MTDSFLKIPYYKKIVDKIFQFCWFDQNQAILLSRADKPAVACQAWPILRLFQIDLSDENSRLAYSLIAAAIARSKSKQNGTVKFGAALSQLFNGLTENSLAKVYFRRLLNCDTIEEVCSLLSTLLHLIQKQQRGTLDYVDLLADLLSFNHRSQQIKIRWTQDFYHGIAVLGKGDK